MGKRRLHLMSGIWTCHSAEEAVQLRLLPRPPSLLHQVGLQRWVLARHHQQLQPHQRLEVLLPPLHPMHLHLPLANLLLILSEEPQQQLQPQGDR
jgi:hypothetical protein